MPMEFCQGKGTAESIQRSSYWDDRTRPKPLSASSSCNTLLCDRVLSAVGLVVNPDAGMILIKKVRHVSNHCPGTAKIKVITTWFKSDF